MDSWNPALYQSWFVVALSKQVVNKPLSVNLLNRLIVIARLRTGELCAFEDRCPHRGVPLSMGKVTDDGLQCAYHGWTFDRQGQCISIPGYLTPACLPHIKANALPCVERDGLVWLRFSANDKVAVEESATLKSLPVGTCRFTWHSTWNAFAADALENFLDALHTHFVHSGIVRRGDRRSPTMASVKRSTGRVEIEYSGQSQQSGILYKLFESPRTSEIARFDALTAGSGQLEYRYRNGSALYFTLHFSPESDARTRVFGTLHVVGRWAPGWALRLFIWPFLRRVAMQDQKIVEAQARNRRHFGMSTGVSTELDLVRPSLDEVWAARMRAPADECISVTMLI